jgi:CubicO group peptidase (beta-lactamase class C family)
MKNNLKIIITISVFLTLSFTAIVYCSGSDEHNNNILYLREQEKAAAAAVLLNNSRSVLPLKKPEKEKIVCINFDSEYSAAFNDMLNRYARVSSITFPVKQVNSRSIKDLEKKIKKFTTVIILTSDLPFGNPAVQKFLNDSQKKHQLILCISGNRDVLKNLDKFRHPVIISDINSAVSAVYAAQVIFGGAGISSKLETGIYDRYPAGSGYAVTPVRLKYTVPEETGINIEDLLPIDEIVKDAISEKATPGAVVMIVKNGRVIFGKSYGNRTYSDEAKPMQVTDIFDLASVTKVAATTIALMRLYDQGKVKLDSPISSYIPETRKSDKKNITIKDLMLHQSGLPADVSFGRLVQSKDYSRKYSSKFKVKAADRCYMKTGFYKNTMWPRILKAPLETKGKYLYSDLSMFYIKEAVERRSGKNIEDFLTNNFYKPLGMRTACFNARDKFPADKLVPTEVDTYFRNSTLLGYVHDQRAAMMGGVAGHAGLFSDANDLAILFQMLLNRGEYGGVRYFKEETVDTFTVKDSELSRRALGFDGWDPESDTGYPSFMASRSIFGHTGFTGTCVWADPEKKLIFIFLSNRTYPNTANKLSKMNIRSRILDVIYMAIKE